MCRGELILGRMSWPSVIPTLKWLGWGVTTEFKTSLEYIVRLYLNKREKSEKTLSGSQRLHVELLQEETAFH